MPLELWLAFVVTSALLLLMPGPTILTVISYSIAHGRQATLPLVTAVALGDATALTFSLLGLGALLKASAFWFLVLKSIGGVYLLYMGIKLLRAGVYLAKSAPHPAACSHRQLFFNTYLVTTFNPKGIVFFVALLPQFISPHAAVGPQMWILAATFIVMAVINTTGYALFASSAQRLFTTPAAQKRFNLAGGTLLCSAGIWALLTRRPV